MRRTRTANPLDQQIKGIFITQVEDPLSSQGLALLQSLDCNIMNQNDNRMMVKTSRAKLLAIKKCWLSNDLNNSLSQELNQCFTQIIIGGSA